MNVVVTYGIIFMILLVLELAYFKIADRFNIIDKPNERSSHSTSVLRGRNHLPAKSMDLVCLLWLSVSILPLGSYPHCRSELH